MTKTPTNTIVRLALLAAAAFTGTAFAGGPTAGQLAFTAADTNTADGKLTKEEFATTFEEGTKAKVIAKAFKKADISKNGTLTLTEFLVSFGEITTAPLKTEVSFDEADTDNNNGISLTELIAATPGKAPIITIVKSFTIANTLPTPTPDTVLSLEEWTLLKTGKAKPVKGTKYLKFDLANADGNDSLSPAEFITIFPRGTAVEKIEAKFIKLDKNTDEVLTRSEYNPGGPKTPPPAP